MNDNCERYVSKNEVKLLRKQFHQWMDKIHNNLKNCGISFTYILVGSAKRNLVIRHHNKGFDCDYQIKITANKKDLNAFEIKNCFINELNKIITVKGYKNCEDSKSAITIKKIGYDSKIDNGYDIVIIQDTSEGLRVLRNTKEGQKPSNYKFELLPEMDNYKERFLQIKGHDMWKSLRDIYYKKKITELRNCLTSKKSFQILNEAVNEVLVKYKRYNNISSLKNGETNENTRL